MKLKRNLSIGIIIVISFINFFASNSLAKTENGYVMEAFSEVEANLIEININASGMVSDKFLNIYQLKNIAYDLIDDLNIKGKLVSKNQIDIDTEKEDYYSIDILESEDQNEIVIYGKNDFDKSITIILQSYNDMLYNIQGTKLVIDMIYDNDDVEPTEMKEKLRGIYDKFNSNTEITTCFAGTFDGKLDNVDKLMKITKIMNMINSDKVEGINNDSIISISAFSPNIDRYIYSRNKKINLNIAMRYNEYEDKTYIWVGTPLISIAY